MGLINWLRGKRLADNSEHHLTTVRIGDETKNLRTTDYAAVEMYRRYHSWPAIIASRLAADAASNTIRLYMPAQSPSRRVRGVKLRRFVGAAASHPVGPLAMKYARDAGGDIEEVYEHDALELIESPNPFMSGTEFREFLFTSDAIAGRSYLMWVAGIGEMYPLYAPYVVPQADSTEMLTGYRYGRDTTDQRTFDLDEVWERRYALSQFSPFEAQGPLSQILSSVDASDAIRETWDSLFKNQARPDYLIHIENSMTKDQVQAFKKSIAQEFRGPRRQARILISHADAKADVKPLSFANKDTGDVLIDDRLIDEICAAFGIPKTSIIMDGTYANSEQGDIAYQRRVLAWGNREADWFTRKFQQYGLIPEGWFFAVDNPVSEDETAKSARTQMLVGAGVLTLNEARTEFGYEPIDGGDVPRVNGQSLENLDQSPGLGSPFGFSPFGLPSPQDDTAEADDSLEVVAEDPDASVQDTGLNGAQIEALLGLLQSVTDGVQSPDVVRELITSAFPAMDPERVDAMVRDAAEFGASRTVPMLGEGEKTKDHKGCCDHHGRSVSHKNLCDTEVAMWVRQIKTPDLDSDGGEVEEAPKALYNGVRKALHKRRDEILKAMDKKPHGLQHGPIATKDDDDLIETLLRAWGVAGGAEDFARDVTGNTDKVVESLLDQFLRTAVGQVAEMRPDVGDFDGLLPGDDVRQYFTEYVRDYEQRFVDVDRTTGEAIRRQLTDGLDAGDTIRELKTRVSGVFNAESSEGVTISEHRAAAIARTETAQAQTSATIKGYKATNVVRGKKWILSPGACEFCESAARAFGDKAVPLDEPFYAKGTTLVGSGGGSMKLDFQDIQAAPLHPQCRCGVLPQLVGED